MSETSKAVFLSYASQDADAARRICETLRAAGVEVWFDADGGLEHGDEWDAKIRKQIKECVLFMPIISANTQARLEGYFRLEWDLAAERARTIASGVPFILPVVIDETREPEALVPDRFRMLQWTKLPGGVVTPEVKARYLKLWSHRAGLAGARSVSPPNTVDAGQRPGLPRRRVAVAAWVGVAVAMVALVGFIALRPKPNADAGTRPAGVAERNASPSSEARKLVAQARLQLDKPEMARTELSAADAFCKRAAELDDGDAEVWATWSQVNTWFVYYNFDGSLARREAARDYAARAMQLAPRSFEARLAQACYWMRGEGLDVGFASDDKPPLYQAEAERMLRELQAEQPDEPRTLLMLGFLRVWKDTANPERYDLLERVTRNPAFAVEAWKEIGWVKFFQGDPVSAALAAERSIAIQPTWNNLWLKTLLATVWMGDLNLAKTTLVRMPVAALQEDVGLYLTYWVYAWRNEPLMALSQIERQPREWLRMSGYLGPKALLTGKLRRMADQPELARRDFLRARELVEQALTTDQNNRNLLSLKAQILHFLGEDDEARRTYRLAHDLGARGPELDALFISPEAGIENAHRYLDGLQDRPNLIWYFTAAALRLHPEYAALRKHDRFPALLARLDADPRFSPQATAPKPARGVIAPDAKSAAADKSVAVLAFANLSDDRNNEYFSDGISEELLNVLAKIPGLKVAARTSAFYFKGKNVPIPEIGQKLGVAYVVEGSVRKAGSEVRITAQLIKADDGFHVWSETFRRDVKDIFAVQDEIAGLIAKNLELKMGMARDRAAANPEAYGWLLQGRFAARQESNIGRRQSIEFYRRAIALEPGYALAWSEMAQSYIRLARFGGMTTADGMKEARLAAQKALDLDPNQPIALDAMGWVQRTADWDWRAAQKTLQRALSLAPENSAILTDAAILYFNVGRIEEALALARQSVARDPLNAMAQINLGDLLWNAGDLPECVEQMSKGIRLAPEVEEYRTHLAIALAQLKRFSEADAMIEAEPNAVYRLFGRGYVALLRGDLAAGAKVRDELVEHHGARMTGYIAMLYCAAGNADEALAWLERGYRERDSSVCWVKTAALYHDLRKDPRWPAYLRKLGLADEQL